LANINNPGTNKPKDYLTDMKVEGGLLQFVFSLFSQVTTLCPYQTADKNAPQIFAKADK